MTWSINETNIVKQEFLSTKNSINWFLNLSMRLQSTRLICLSIECGKISKN